ncbi:MAG: hypothetical protein CMG77_14610 [Marinimicrobium sp.]|nr:hypothetical protein [Marinimicrobium sp.]
MWGGLLLAGTVTALAAEPVVVPEGNFEHPVLLDRERRTEWVASFRVDFGGGSCGDTGRLILRYDSAHYATLLRYQMRSNHAPETTASNLGFRCVYP